MRSDSLDDRSIWRLDTFLVPEGAISEASVELDGPEGHHAVNVVRVRAGDRVRLIDGLGSEALGVVAAVARSTATIDVAESREHSREDGFRLTVAQGLLKGRAFEEVVRRCSETGVESIVPLETERTIVHVPDDATGPKLARWRAVAVAAVKQSRGVFLPTIGSVTALERLELRAGTGELSLVAWEEEGETDLLGALKAVTEPSAGTLVVGPEGGLSADEVGLLRSRGALTVSAGRRILRADWAAAALAAVVSSQYGGLLP